MLVVLEVPGVGEDPSRLLVKEGPEEVVGKSLVSRGDVRVGEEDAMELVGGGLVREGDGQRIGAGRGAEGDPVASGLEQQAVKGLTDPPGRIAKAGSRALACLFGRTLHPDDRFPVGRHQNLSLTEEPSVEGGDPEGGGEA